MVVKKEQHELIVGLDIGTSKIVAIIGEVTDDSEVKILGMGSHPSRGMKKGIVVDLESIVQSIQRAIEEAELMSDCQVHGVYAGIAGSHISSMNSHGMVAIKDRNEITVTDLERVLDAARAVALPGEQRVLHVLPQEYMIDDQEGIREPVGMSGVRLEAKVHLVTAADSAVQNIEKCIRRCGLEVDEIVVEQLASSLAVLTDDDKELGVCLVDIGAGTTDIAVFAEGSIRHTAVIPIAGDQVTNDIAVALRTPTQNAEEIKIRYGCALRQLAAEDELIEVPAVGDKPSRSVSRHMLASVLEPRYEELFELVRAELQNAGFLELLGSGIVLTGGSAKMEGVEALAEEVFHTPVRIEAPQNVTGQSEVVRNPIYSTGVGLLLYGVEARKHNKAAQHGDGGLWVRVKKWLGSF